MLDSSKHSAETEGLSCLVSVNKKGEEQNDENGLGEENCDSSNVPRNMRRMSYF